MHVVSDFRVQCKTELDEKLDAAVAAACDEASIGRGHGVLVVRHDFDHFSVALSPQIPFGIIHERDMVSRN